MVLPNRQRVSRRARDSALKTLVSIVIATNAEEFVKELLWEAVEQLGYDRVEDDKDMEIKCPKLNEGTTPEPGSLSEEEEMSEYPFTVLGKAKLQQEDDELPQYWAEGEEHNFYVIQVKDFYQNSSGISFHYSHTHVETKLARKIEPTTLLASKVRTCLVFVPITEQCTIIKGFANNVDYCLPHYQRTESKKFACGEKFKHDVASCVHKLKRRCHRCGKKAHLAYGTECECGYVFCAQHKFPQKSVNANEDQDHECTFDFDARAKRILKKRVSDESAYANSSVPRGGEGI